MGFQPMRLWLIGEPPSPEGHFATPSRYRARRLRRALRALLVAGPTQASGLIHLGPNGPVPDRYEGPGLPNSTLPNGLPGVTTNTLEFVTFLCGVTGRGALFSTGMQSMPTDILSWRSLEENCLLNTKDWPERAQMYQPSV